MALSVKIDGISEFVTFAAKVGAVGGPARLRPILQDGGDVIKAGVQASIAAMGLIRTGAMREAIVSRLHRRQDEAVSFVTVDSDRLRKGKNGKAVRYPFILAAGSKPHVIGPGARVLAAGDVVFGRTVKHPGHSRYPFFQAGFNATKAAAAARIADGVAAELQRIKAEYGA